MTEWPEPQIIAEIGGLVVAERGPYVIVVDRGSGAYATITFVLSVLTLVLGGFGATTLALTASGSSGIPRWLSASLLLLGLAVAGAVVGVRRRVRGIGARPLSTFTPVAIFDRAQRVFRDAAGGVIAPLDQVRFESRTQVTSSSPMLVAVTPGGIHLLKRGNPFNGGLGNLESMLTTVVFAPPD